MLRAFIPLKHIMVQYLTEYVTQLYDTRSIWCNRDSVLYHIDMLI